MGCAFSSGVESSDVSLLIEGGGLGMLFKQELGAGGRWGTFFKQELGRGYNFYLKIFWQGSVSKHYTFLKTAPEVINNRSLRIYSQCTVTSVTQHVSADFHYFTAFLV